MVYELPFHAFSEQEKVAISIGRLLSDKFEAKKRDMQKKLDLINRNNKLQMSLKYHEAWALKNICINRISWLESDFQKRNIQNAITQIDSYK